MAEYFTSQEEGNTGATEPAGDNDQNEIAPPSYTGPRTLDGRPAPESGKKPVKSTGAAGGRGGIATLGSLNQASSGQSGSSRGARMNEDDDEDDDDFLKDPDFVPDQEPRDLFAGGEKSGLAVQDPSRKPDQRKIVNDILKQAKE